MGNRGQRGPPPQKDKQLEHGDQSLEEDEIGEETFRLIEQSVNDHIGQITGNATVLMCTLGHVDIVLIFDQLTLLVRCSMFWRPILDFFLGRRRTLMMLVMLVLVKRGHRTQQSPTAERVLVTDEPEKIGRQQLEGQQDEHVGQHEANLRNALHSLIVYVALLCDERNREKWFGESLTLFLQKAQGFVLMQRTTLQNDIKIIISNMCSHI